MNTCPRCELTTTASQCCGVIFAARQPWIVTTAMAREIHVLARSRKGLDDETYRLRLTAFGVSSCKDLTREQWPRFVALLHSLPNASRRNARSQSQHAKGKDHGTFHQAR